MLQHRGHDNQRIERLCVNTFQSVLCIFYNIFSSMEELHILDVGSDTQLWALHYVFMPRLQRNLDTFVTQWNTHGLTTEHGKSPYQLFTTGILENHASQYTGVQAFVGEEQEGAEAEREVVTGADDAPRPALSMVQCPLTQDQVTDLEGRINPLDDADRFGIDIYKRVLMFVSENS